jgi:2,4-dienoyl-CoA reductase (NADPH2)
MKGVRLLPHLRYDRISDRGVHVTDQGGAGAAMVIPCDTVVLCTGQVSRTGLAEGLRAANRPFHLIGGADVAAELDAQRAIDQGARLAAAL